MTTGVIGAGDIARTAHVPVLKALEGTSLDWVADVDAKRAAAMGKAYGVRHVVLTKDSEPPAADVLLLAIPYGARPFLRCLPQARHCSLCGKAVRPNR